MVDDMAQKIIPARAAGPAAGDARTAKRPSAQAGKRTSLTNKNIGLYRTYESK